MPAPLPDNEAARLDALRRYNILDTTAEEAFDDLTHLAAHICGAPIALVTLVDANRQWFKARVGLDALETPRDIAFCAYTILEPDSFVVPNALADERFVTNPLVTSAPNIQFYAGVPLITPEGQALGALCVIDHVPRDLSSEQMEALRALGRQVIAQLELRRTLADLAEAMTERKQTERVQVLFEYSTDAHLIFDETGIIDCNNAAIQMLRCKDKQEVLTLHPAQLSPEYQPDGRRSLEKAVEMDATARERGYHRFEWIHRRMDGEDFPVEVTLNPVTLNNKPALLVVWHDISERKRAEEVLRENEALYQSLIDALPQNVYRIDRAGRVTFGNKAYLANLGMTLDECRGKTVHDFFPKELADKYEADDEEVMQGGEIIEIVESYKSPIANEMSYVQTVKVPIRDSSGKVIGIQGIYWDITKSKRAELALTKRAVELETVARVGTAASTILEIDKLLQEVVDLTKSSFGLYHAHVYLLNPTGDTLVLAAGTGEVGQQMVNQGWSISLEREHSLVVQAVGTRQGVIVNDVHQEPNFLPNPLLPETRAELAVPLIAGEQVLGVLDVQADGVDRFTEEDMRLKTILAGQIAAALQNARSFAEQQRATLLLSERVKELNCLNEISREIVETPPVPELLQWITERIPPAMRYPELSVAAIEYEGQVYGVPEAIGLPCQIVHALRIGGEVMGRIYISYTEKHDFLDEESALIGGIAGRVGSYIESRRLLEQIQQRAVEFEEASSFLDSIIENIPTGIFIKDAKDLKYLRINPAHAHLSGLNQVDVIGTSVYDYFPKEQADFFTAKDRETLARGELVDIPEQPMQTADKGPRWLHTQKVPIYGLDGQPKYLLGMSEDITERKQAERIIVQQKEFFSKVINSIPVGLFAKDVQNDYRFSLWNTKMEELFGVKREDMLGKTDYDYSDKEVADDYRKFDIAAIEAGQLIDIPVEEITTSQGVRLAHTTKLPIYDNEGKPEVLLVVLEDITERKQAEAERERLLAEVEATYRQYVRQEWSQFLSEQYQGDWHIEHQQDVQGSTSNVQYLTSTEKLAEVQDEVIRNGKTKVIVGASGNGHGVEPAIVAPIALRGQVIGTLSLQDVAPERQWTDDEMALVETVSEQLALTLENLRLIEESQRNAWRDQVVSESTAKVWSSSEIEEVMKAAVAQLGDKLRASEVVIRLGTEKELAQE